MMCRVDVRLLIIVFVNIFEQKYVLIFNVKKIKPTNKKNATFIRLLHISLQICTMRLDDVYKKGGE